MTLLWITPVNMYKCMIWYHADCVWISKSQGKHMERNGEEFVCPVCMSAGD